MYRSSYSGLGRKPTPNAYRHSNLNADLICMNIVRRPPFDLLPNVAAVLVLLSGVALLNFVLASRCRRELRNIQSSSRCPL